ncbi:MAG TPA: IS1380 family transposase [Candidatus Competibacteraceae bacterium]|nr:IS1380 family transposase [Candidatus Competibacteraceae bacterium]
MPYSTQESLRFPPVAGLTVRGDFEGGALSSDFGPLLLRGVDRQIGLTQRLAAAFQEQRHPSYLTHPLQDWFAQRLYQLACAYADGNDAHALRTDPVVKLGLERLPLDAAANLASASTLSRWENAATRKDIYRLAVAFIDQFIASYAHPPAVIVLDLDHSEDAAYGQQELIFYNAYYRNHCYLPLFIFEGLSGKFITAALRPGQRPTGAENAMIVQRVLKRLRAAWPDPHFILRGDAHFATPEVMQRVLADPQADFLFGLRSNAVLKSLAQPFLEATRRQHEVRGDNARRHHQPAPAVTRTYHELDYAAQTWPRPFRVVLKAEVMALGDNPRVVVTSLDRPTPKSLYGDLYCARGQDENWIKMLKNDLASDRTSDHRFLANHLRLFFSCGAYVLHHALRTEVLVHTELAQAQPATVILKLFKIAVRVVQYKDRIKLQLPSSCPVKALLHQVTEILFQVGAPGWNTS